MGNVWHRSMLLAIVYYFSVRQLIKRKCRDIADHFPSAQVIGTDLSPIQPREVPPNLQFEIDDACSEWVYAKDSFDFIHVRGMYGSVSDWAFFYNQVYQ